MCVRVCSCVSVKIIKTLLNTSICPLISVLAQRWGSALGPAQVPFWVRAGGRGGVRQRGLTQAVLAELCPKLRGRAPGRLEAKGRGPTLRLRRAGKGHQSWVLGQCPPQEFPAPCWVGCGGRCRREGRIWGCGW